MIRKIKFIMWYLKLRGMKYSHEVSIMALKSKGARFYKLKNRET